MKKEQMTLVNRINSLCKERGMSYYILSYKSGVPLSTLMHIMDGTVKNPGFYTIVRLCAGMRITLAEFFDTEDFKRMVETAGTEE